MEAKRPIRLLSEEMANQIAAGEVVERPASVLKELVENSLDAGSTRVTIEVAGGGRRLIRVVDDGAGMSADDVLLAVERHATSKVASAEDLDAIGTYGFRGEALPSIGAVSRLTLRSRRQEDASGHLLLMNHGRIAKVEEVGCPVGTLVEMADLFGNIPARKKFLKSNATENAHLGATFTRLALARPDVAFRYSNNDRVLFDLPAGAGLAARAGALLGREAVSQMVAVEYAGEAVSLRGLAGLPSLGRNAWDQAFTFVNGRYVRDRVLLHAIGLAVKGILPEGRKPVVVLDLLMDPALVDANVHPAKVEVRFHEQQQVHDAVVRGLRAALAAGRAAAPGREPRSPAGRVAQPGERITPPMGPRPAWQRPPEAEARAAAQTWPEARPAPSRQPAPPPAASAPPAQGPPPSRQAGFAPRPLFGRAADLSLIGQMHGLYILASSPAGLVLVDQHAAHERLTYEELKAALARGRAPSQGLLVPVTVELSLAESAQAEQQAPAWERLGLLISPFGGRTWAVNALPAALAGRDPAGLLKGLLAEMHESGLMPDTPEFAEKAAQTLACHGSIRGGRRLSPAEQQALLDRLATLPPPLTCPHGRPVMLLVPIADLSRAFGRG